MRKSALLDGRDFLELAHARDASVLSAQIKTDGLAEDEAAKKYSITKLRNRLIVGMAARQIARALSSRCVIATARVRAGMKGNFLHPVATWPSALNSFFLDPRHYEDFRFGPAALTGDSGTELIGEHADWQGRIYDLKQLDDKGRGTDCFAGRIDAFLNQIKTNAKKYGVRTLEVDELRAAGVCLVLGGMQDDKEFIPAREKRKEFHDFFALYLLPDESVSEAGLGVRTEALKGVGQFMAQMFSALRISDREDKEHFERESLALVAELVPALANPDTTPSDAISHFLERLGKVLEGHTLGVDERHTWVRFVAIDTVFDDQNTYTPRFHVFPDPGTATMRAGSSSIRSCATETRGSSKMNRDSTSVGTNPALPETYTSS